MSPTPPRLIVRVDVDRPVGTIDRHIFGHFVEHLGRCIYGGIFDPGSPLADERGFRRDVLEATQRLRVPNLRWPGGNFASAYHWEDGIGPPSQRVPRFDLAWRALEPNTFGTDEFLAYARELDAAPYICVNSGSGTLIEAAHWVEYCNLPAERFPSHHALLRGRNGHPEPYGVPLWGIGNEVYGAWQVGHAGAEAYARKCRELAYFMRAVDPTIELVAVGADQTEWDETVLEIAGDAVDYISIHQYHGQEDYAATVGAAAYVEQRLHRLGETIERAMRHSRRTRPVRIAMDEWNVCYVAWGTGETLPEPVVGEYFELWEQRFALKDALFAAGVFHAMFRECRHVTLANLAQLVNANGMLETRPDGLLRTAIYYAFDLYANHTGATALPTTVTAREGSVPGFGVEDWRDPAPRYVGLREPFLRFALRDVPYLDAQASLAADGLTLYLSVINYHPLEAIAAGFDFGGYPAIGAVDVLELNGADTHTANTFERPDVTGLSATVLPALPETYVFPAHSATVFEIRVAPSP
jgi:alpha-N-arabinofuranosidase